MPLRSIHQGLRYCHFRRWLVGAAMLGSLSALIGADAAPDEPTSAPAKASSSTSKQMLRVLTDSDGHVFTISSGENRGWIYGIIHDLTDNNVDLIVLTFYATAGQRPSYSMPIATFSKEDQQYIKDWAAQHSANILGSLPATPPAAPTGVTVSFSQEVITQPQRGGNRGGGRRPATVTINSQVDTSGVLKGKTITAIAHGANHTLALCSDGTLVAWGSNVFGQLGDGQHSLHKEKPNMEGYAISPVLVHRPGAFKDKKIAMIAAAGTNSYALCTDGSLYVWGAEGQSRDEEKPVDEPALFDMGVIKDRKIVAIAPNAGSRPSTGMDNCLALCDDGTLIGWGYSFRTWGPGMRTADSYSGFRDPFVVNTRGVLAGKTVVTLTTWGMLCSDGTLAMWHYSPPTPHEFKFAELRLIKMDGLLEGKTITAIAENEYPMVLCSDGTLVAWGGSVEPPHTSSSDDFPDQSSTPKPKPAPDDVNAPISSEDVKLTSGRAPPTCFVSGVGALKGKKVTSFAGSLIQCSDGTQAYWPGNGPPELVDKSGWLRDKTILAMSGQNIMLFKESGTPAPAAAKSPAPTASN